MTIEQMLDQIRSVMAKCKAPEKEVYEALCCEAEGWEMRLRELEDGEDDLE
jgi:hypothetical protein